MTTEVVVEEEFVRQERLWLPELESLSSISCRSVDLPLPSTDPFLSCWRGGPEIMRNPSVCGERGVCPPGMCSLSCCRELLSYRLMEVIADIAHIVSLLSSQRVTYLAPRVSCP